MLRSHDSGWVDSTRVFSLVYIPFLSLQPPTPTRNALQLFAEPGSFAKRVVFRDANIVKYVAMEINGIQNLPTLL
jgi:hypothetical protein